TPRWARPRTSGTAPGPAPTPRARPEPRPRPPAPMRSRRPACPASIGLSIALWKNIPRLSRAVAASDRSEPAAARLRAARREQPLEADEVVDVQHRRRRAPVAVGVGVRGGEALLEADKVVDVQDGRRRRGVAVGVARRRAAQVGAPRLGVP